MAAAASTGNNQDYAIQVIKKYRSYVGVIVESNIGRYINTYCIISHFLKSVLLWNFLIITITIILLSTY